MITSPHVSQETDRRVHQVLSNMTSLNKYREQKAALEMMQLRLAETVIDNHLKGVAPSRLTAAIKSGEAQLAAGIEFNDAVKHCSQLLKDEQA